MNAFDRLSKFSQSGHIIDCTAWIFPFKKGYNEYSKIELRDGVLVNCRVNQDDNVKILEVLQTSRDIDKYNEFRLNYRDQQIMAFVIIGEDRLPRKSFSFADINILKNASITRTFRFEEGQFNNYGLKSPHIAFLD